VRTARLPDFRARALIDHDIDTRPLQHGVNVAAEDALSP
jgi:hypothetical protein